MSAIPIPGGTLYTDKQLSTLNDELLRQQREFDERVQKLISGIAQDVADLDALIQAAKDAGFPNARIVSEEISRHWEATSDEYKVSQPYHNDLYSY